MDNTPKKYDDDGREVNSDFFHQPQIDTSFRSAALTAAIGLLLMIIAAGFAETYRTALIVEGDTSATVQNIIDQTSKLRLSILGYVIVIILDILVAWGLYVYFKPINKSLSLLTAWFRLLYAALFFVAVFNLVDVVQLTGSATDGSHTQIMSSMQAYANQWNFSFVIFGLHLVLLGWLAFKTQQMHKIFGILLIVAGLGYSIDGLGNALIANYALNLIIYTFIGEVLLMFWLFFKGRKIQPAIRAGDHE